MSDVPNVSESIPTEFGTVADQDSGPEPGGRRRGDDEVDQPHIATEDDDAAVADESNDRESVEQGEELPRGQYDAPAEDDQPRDPETGQFVPQEQS